MTVEIVLRHARVSVAIDDDSWAWELRATLLGEASIATVRDAAQPVEIEAEINGHTWRGVLDGWSRDWVIKPEAWRRSRPSPPSPPVPWCRPTPASRG